MVPHGPNGEAFRGTRATNSFAVETPGRLYVASYFPGEWSTRQGDLDMLILHWQGEPLDGLSSSRRLAMSTTCSRLRSAGC